MALALYTATSIRVGTLLGENEPERSKTAAMAGVSYAVLCGLIMGGLMYLLRKDLAWLFSPLDENVRYLICDNIMPVVVFYFLSCVQYGLWAVLEGQMRIMTTGLCISMGTWAVSIPLMSLYMPIPIDGVFLERGNCDPTSIDWQMSYAEPASSGAATCQFVATGDLPTAPDGTTCPTEAFATCVVDSTPFRDCEGSCPVSSGCTFAPEYRVPLKDKDYCNDFMANATWGSTLCQRDDNCSYTEPLSPMFIM